MFYGCYDMLWYSVGSLSRELGQFKCIGVRSKSNNETWRVFFR